MPVVNGGTGISTIADGEFLYATGANVVGKTGATNVDGQLNVGREFYGGGGPRDVNISASAGGTPDQTDLGFLGIYGARVSTGITQAALNTFNIFDCTAPTTEKLDSPSNST